MSEKSKKMIRALRWTGRILGILLILLVLVFAIGEGAPNPFTQPFPANVQFFAWGLCLIGYLVAWRRERLATGMILGGMAAFYIINYMAARKLPGGILLLACWFHRLRTERQTACDG